jgi:hypothetical protein
MRQPFKRLLKSRANGQANAFNGACLLANTRRLLERSRKWPATFSPWAMTFLTSSLLDRKAGDLRIETAMCKMWATETT